jgi:hypothetical protein
VLGPETTGHNALFDATWGIPSVSEIKDSFVSAFRWATREGAVFDHWQAMSGDPLDPNSTVGEAVLGVRKRKGIKAELPTAAAFMDTLSSPLLFPSQSQLYRSRLRRWLPLQTTPRLARQRNAKVLRKCSVGGSSKHINSSPRTRVPGLRNGVCFSLSSFWWLAVNAQCALHHGVTTPQQRK